ncbi:NAD(P)/FAD-dependent oxidoreductase [Altererythrobacter lutimaris]|uniref:FAD-binding oxidoreductase n=1 Tax=Altererythrobacter lutimaris TaxID=2743979 RepID=A0A850HHR3_9SPHN|nr:FAD-dependent oxidoreductase [Altererythrobacter lutimaris]NVE94742.1 FAD-binding oxidoreductase [Altererythrobacter lutimaris]
MPNKFDIAIIGAGMAGASLAAELAEHGARNIVLLEAESHPGFHSTGRSAAFWEECYGGPEIVPLTLASGSYLRDGGFLTPRGALYLAREEDEPKIAAHFERFGNSGAQFERIDRTQLVEKLHGLRSHWDRAIWQSRCADIDVAGLHQHYLGIAKRQGVTLQCHARVAHLNKTDAWQIGLANGETLTADRIVNAAGAWADQIAQLAGAQPLGIQPLRRTVVQLRIDPAPRADMPLCLDISGDFYFKPENGRLWLSPHDETPSDALDAAPEEIDVAIAIDRLESVAYWNVEAVERKWAGLRSFAPDRKPVYGYDPKLSEFFWFAGQGGYGIQTAPAAARLGAQLFLQRPADAMTAAIEPANYAAARFL